MKSNQVVHALSWFLIVQARAFAPSNAAHVSLQGVSLRRGSMTQLWGLRSFLRRRLSNRNSSPSTPMTAEFPIEFANDKISADGSRDAPDSFLKSNTVDSTTRLRDYGASVSTVAADQRDYAPKLPADILTLERVLEDSEVDKPYVLPPVGDRYLTKLEKEFREMLVDFSRYTERDILAVRNPRMRSIFQGVAASYSLPEVYRAFEILFEDYAPLRIAARLVYGKLKSVMMEAQSERHTQVETVSEMTGLSREEVEASRSAYFKLAVQDDDTATEMSLSQIVDCGLAEMAVEVLGYETFDDFVELLNPCEKQKVDFEKLILALQNCPVENTTPECNPAMVLEEIAGRLDTRKNPSQSDTKDQKKVRLNERYDSMVENFREWKRLVPQGDGRRLEVLQGCFVGAESPEIVEALRVVYIDYSALRMSGDLIFKVMASLVGRTR